MSIRFLSFALLAAACFLPVGHLAAAEKKEKIKALSPFKVLVFTKTTEFRHDSIEVGTELVKKLGQENGFAVDATEDANKFTVEALKDYQVVIFLNTTGDVLDGTQEKVFEQYIRSGRGYVGVHAASDTEKSWPFYETLVGAIFNGHPATQSAKIQVLDKKHPATAHLSDIWESTDEWYNFRKPPTDVHVLLKMDTKSYSGSGHGDNHPMCWYHGVDAGRSFYTGLGHTKESYADPVFQKHLLGGIVYASGVLEKAPTKDKKKK